MKRKNPISEQQRRTAAPERSDATLAGEIDQIGEKEANCRRLKTVPGIGPLISTAVVAAIRPRRSLRARA
jgi:transposase